MFRWTGASSEVSLIGLDAGATEVVIWMSHGGRPSAAPSPDVTVSLGGVTLGSVVPDDEVRPYRFAVPRTLAARLAASDDAAELRLDVSTWSPQQLLGTPDPRELGVMVTRVQVQ